jgi:hypothetical protein
MSYIKEQTKQDFIKTYGKLPNDTQYIKLFELLTRDDGIDISAHYVQRNKVTEKEFNMELKDFWAYDYDDYEDGSVEYTFAVSGSFRECVLSAINMIDEEFGADHDYMSVRGDVEKILSNYIIS